MLLVLRTPLCCVSCNSIFLYDVHVLLYLYSLRFHFAWPRESSHFRRINHVFVARPRALLRFIPMCCRAISVAFTCDLIIMRRSISALIKLCIICYRAVRRGLDRTPGPRPCSCVDSSFFFLSARQPRSLARNSVCCSRLANSTRSANLHSRRLPSTSLGGGECGGYLLVLATVPRCRAPHISNRR